MHITRFTGRILILPLMLAALLAGSAGAAEVEMQFYGNQHFRLKSPGGKVILIRPDHRNAISHAPVYDPEPALAVDKRHVGVFGWSPPAKGRARDFIFSSRPRTCRRR